MIFWLVGLSGSGKSTIAKALATSLPNGFLIDGDDLRAGICNDLGFDSLSRQTQVKRASDIAMLASANGCNVVCALITPYEGNRTMLRRKFAEVDHRIVYISTPLEVCEERDVKGLYKLARMGVLKNFTGVSDPFEFPVSPDVTVDTTDKSVDECVDIIMDTLQP